jgi:hypothetical protein
MFPFNVKTALVSTVLAFGSLVAAPVLVEAAIIPYDFEVNINFGPLLGNIYNGSLSYDELATGVTDPGGFISLPLSDFAFTFLGTNYTEADDPTSTVDVTNPGLSFLGLNYSVSDFSTVSGAFTLNLADSSFNYTINGSGGTGTITYRLSSSAIPEPSLVLGFVSLGLGALLKKGAF